MGDEIDSAVRVARERIAAMLDARATEFASRGDHRCAHALREAHAQLMGNAYIPLAVRDAMAAKRGADARVPTRPAVDPLDLDAIEARERELLSRRETIGSESNTARLAEHRQTLALAAELRALRAERAALAAVAEAAAAFIAADDAIEAADAWTAEMLAAGRDAVTALRDALAARTPDAAPPADDRPWCSCGSGTWYDCRVHDDAARDGAR